MANKKNKRLSLSSSLSSSSSASSSKQTDTIERTPENDYGVLSDPDEVNEVNDLHPETVEPERVEPAASPVVAENVIVILHESPQKTPSSSPPNTPPIQPQIQPQMQPSSQPEPLDQTSQIVSHPEPTTTTSSMDRLKLILSTDKKYEEKMTLHTFFSFVVMAMDIASGAGSETETLVEYLINNHSVNEYTKAYLQTLVETDVVKNIIQSILQFNNEHPDNFTKLVSSEQPAADEPKIIVADAPPSRIRSFFKRLFCCCCCRSHRPRRNSLSSSSSPPPTSPIILNETEMDPVVQEDATQEEE